MKFPIFRAKARSAVKQVGDLVDSSVLWSLSKAWYLIVGSYLFPLHPKPFCGAYVPSPCAMDASWDTQLLFSFATLIIMTVVKSICEGPASESAKKGTCWDPEVSKVTKGLLVVPKICAYVVGWCFGAALWGLFDTMKATAPLCLAPVGYDGLPNCAVANFIVSAIVSVIAGLLIFLIKPFVEYIDIQFLPDWADELIERFLSLLSAAGVAITMTFWYNTFSSYVMTGIPKTDRMVVMHVRFFWAGSASFWGALLYAAMVSAEEAARSNPNWYDGKKITIKAPWWCAPLMQLSDLSRNSISFVAGTAWSDLAAIMLPFVGSEPTLLNVVALILLGAFSITVAAGWLILTATEEEASEQAALPIVCGG